MTEERFHECLVCQTVQPWHESWLGTLGRNEVHRCRFCGVEWQQPVKDDNAENDNENRD